MLFAWFLESASKTSPVTFMNQIKNYSATEVASVALSFYETIQHSPSSVLFLAVLIFGLKSFSSAKSEVARWITGGIHALAHVVLNVGLIWLFASLNLTNHWVRDNLGIYRTDQPLQALLFSAEMFVIGGFLGGLLMGLYMLISELLGKGTHVDEIFSALRIADYKNFLRMRIKSDGTLEIYPIGVTRTCRDWEYKSNATGGKPWFEPAGEKIETHLIEGPIVLGPRATS
jgi:hypothetical protein